MSILLLAVIIDVFYLPCILFLRSLEKTFPYKDAFLMCIEFSLISLLTSPSN